MGALRTRKRGKNWEWAFEVAKVDGKRKSISKGGYKTKAEAVKAGTAAKAEYDNGGKPFNPANLSVADYLDYWLENQVKKNLSYRTYIDYESKVRLHIKPTLGIYRLNSLEPDTIQVWIDDIKQQNYSINTTKSVLSCLTAALSYAVMPLKYIKYNPCTYVKLKRLKEEPKLKEKREYICTSEDWQRIITRFPEGSNFYIPLITSYHLGTRISETYGIDLLNDVDFENNIIHIRQQLQKQGKVWTYQLPKYESYRDIEMGETYKKILKAEIRKRKAATLKYGSYYLKTYLKPDNTIIQLPASESTKYKEIMPLSVKENGELLNTKSFEYCTKVIHHKLGLTYFHSHCLRHTHGTILAENGVNPKSVMERLGHKDINTTLKHYIFNSDKMKQNAINIFESAIS